MNYKLYYHGGSKNHGCEAIVRSIKKLLGKNAKLIVFSVKPNEDRKFKLDEICEIKKQNTQFKIGSLKHIKMWLTAHALNSYYSYFPDLCDSIAENDIFISVGGDNYCYNGQPEKLAYINRRARKSGVKTVLLGCSIAPALLEKKEVIKDMNRYSLIIARESITYNSLLKAGVTQNVYLIPDPAFILDKVYCDINEFIPNNTVGINLSPLVQKLESVNGITYKNFSCLVKNILEKTNMNVALIPHVTWENNTDIEPLRQLYNKYKDTDRICLFGDQYNCMELKGFISRCRFFIGARTHATIAAYSTCVPTLVVGYSVKARGIARDIFGTEKNYVIPVQSLEHESDLVNAFKYIQENEESIRKHLQDFMPSYIEKAWQAGEEVKKILEN